jgi:pimeloyl-ACP methyl ester carboxylesterase
MTPDRSLLLRWRISLCAACALATFTSCSTVSVRRVRAPELLDAWRASVLSAKDISPRTLQTLRQMDLETVYRRDSGEAVARLHDAALNDPQPDFLFALAEINYFRGRAAERHSCHEAVGYYYLCAGYAYHYLFATCRDEPMPGTGKGERKALAPLSPLDAFDPRFRLACDLYNAGLAKCLRAAQQAGRLDTRHELRVPIGDDEGCTLSVVHVGFPWQPEDFGPIQFSDDFQVEGLANQYRTYGLGVPLIVTRDDKAPRTRPGTFPANVSFPASAFVRFDGGLEELGKSRAGRLELYNPLSIQVVEVQGRAVPLETDLTTPLAYFLAGTDLDRLQYLGFLRVDLLQGRTGIYMPEPYQPGKIPVLLVHGLLSSPLTWAPLFNDLRADPRLRERFQFWVYFYPTGNPYLKTAADLRRALARLRDHLDPELKDPALDQMVLVGHSMGGLVSKMMTVDSGDDFWGLVSERPFEDLRLSPATRDGLHDMFFFVRQPCVRRVVFLGTPHHGSQLSPALPGRLADHLIRLPKTLLGAAHDLSAENPDLPLRLWGGRVPTSVDLLAPGSPALEVLAARPLPEGVHYHSIIGVVPPSDTVLERLFVGGAGCDSGDGVVPYCSAHLDGVDSELVVPADHFTVHQHPLSVLEVRRILLEHLKGEE